MRSQTVSPAKSRITASVKLLRTSVRDYAGGESCTVACLPSAVTSALASAPAANAPRNKAAQLATEIAVATPGVAGFGAGGAPSGTGIHGRAAARPSAMRKANASPGPGRSRRWSRSTSRRTCRAPRWPQACRARAIRGEAVSARATRRAADDAPRRARAEAMHTSKEVPYTVYRTRMPYTHTVTRTP